MLGFFPRLLEEELLYSGIARYRAALGRASNNNIHVHLMRSSTDAATVGLPGRLKAFVENFPVPLDVDGLIDRHTLLPYYARFSRPSVIAAVRSDMWDGSVSRMRFRLGVDRSGPKRPKWLRSCAACAREDVDANGTSFWRRVHQLYGVVVCPDHEIALLEHSIDARAQKRFISHEQAPQGKRVFSPLPLALAVRLARSSLWLLANPGPPIGPEIATRGVEQLLEGMTGSRRVAFGPEVRLNTLPRHASLSPKCEKGQEAHAPPLQRSRWDGPVSRRES